MTLEGNYFHKGVSIMNVITSFKEKKREKQVTYERKMLRELSLEGLKNNVNNHFGSYFKAETSFSKAIEEGCIDVAIESYLLGARFSKFGYFGESEEAVKTRCYSEQKYLADTLFEFLSYWGQIGDDFANESLYYNCDHYVEYWWLEGFSKGEKRYRLRLH
jgi:hypothetical protein